MSYLFSFISLLTFATSVMSWLVEGMQLFGF